MKDFDLESKVKAVRVPERDEDYWEAFPRRMLTELRSVPVERPVRRAFIPGLLWGQAGSGLPDAGLLPLAEPDARGAFPCLAQR